MSTNTPPSFVGALEKQHPLDAPRGTAKLVCAVAVGSLDQSPDQLLDEALARGHFWQNLDALRISTGRSNDQVHIAIKPDMDFFRPGAPTGTSPDLVETLVQRLVDAGFTAVTVIDGCNVDDSWLHNRTPLSVPDLVGYHFASPSGQAYAMVGAADAKHQLDLGNGLEELAVNSHWLAADFRIIFAKNKTDEGLAFALGAFNLLGLLPDLRSRAQGGMCMEGSTLCVEFLRRVPVHFCLIDAIVSSHGASGSCNPCPLKTNTLIASPSLLLADWVAAVKMGADPYASPLNARALHQLGLPDDFEIDGCLALYPHWENPSPIVMDSIRCRDRSSLVARLARAFTQSVDRELFPFRELAIDRINSYVTGFSSGRERVDNGYAWWVLPLNYLAGGIERAIWAHQVLYQKEYLPWMEVPLQFHYGTLPQHRYDDVPKHVGRQEQLLRDAPLDRHGFQWRFLNGAVLFRGCCVLDKAFSAFTKTVEIHRVIQYMNDYIGGSAIPVTLTDDGKVERQVERNLYLPQPNWTVLFGGDIIDVEKIEKISYENDRHKIWWQTVSSPNDSAECDDGSLEFGRTADGRTEVVIFTFQKFRLPPALAALRIEFLPDLRDALVGAAYANFFHRTVNNLRLLADGGVHRIGHKSSEGERHPTTSVADFSLWGAAVAGLLGELFSQGSAWTGWLGHLLGPSRSMPKTGTIDEHGFRHFPGETRDAERAGRPEAVAADWLTTFFRQAPAFLCGLSDAIRKDIAAMGEHP